MTTEKAFNIQSVAIIGAGAAGLTTLFELLHTGKDGSTTIRYNENGELDERSLKNNNPAFKKVVCFEQNPKIGGIWAPSFDDPEEVSQDLFNTERYDDPWILRPKTPIPNTIKTKNYSRNEPLVTEKMESGPVWNKSGIYRHLFSNVPGRYLRNSFIPYDQNHPTNNTLHPLITNEKVTNNLQSFTEHFCLTTYVRLNSEVVEVHKANCGSQWKLTVSEESRNDKTVKWYTESFDAVIISTGHYSVPCFPKIRGLSDWNAQFSSSILHSKSFRDPEPFRNKKVLFIGTGLSGVDILQYTFPIASSVIVSRTIGKREIYPWLTKAATSEGIIIKPRIKELKPAEGRKVIFEDGSSIDFVDYLVFSTGYHWHYPFLSKDVSNVSVVPSSQTSIPNGSSMVDGLFLNTFAVKDPSLAFVGITVTPLKWPSFEITAATIAGVWTNHAELPTQKDQKNYNINKLKQTGTGLLFHYYSVDDFSDYVDELAPYLPKNRRVANIYDKEHLADVEAASIVAERLFYEYKQGKLLIENQP